ncbi:ubiquitin-conjugating enzyme/RWD-like protein, partial [Chytridium lagenaria]
PGITAWPVDDADGRIFQAEIEGPVNSPYEECKFQLMAKLPDRYPFEPPQVSFRTPVYHPNVDAEGRICSDVLKMPPKGCWSPTMNLNVVFGAIRMLLAEPNPDDPLEHQIVSNVVMFLT